MTMPPSLPEVDAEGNPLARRSPKAQFVWALRQAGREWHQHYSLPPYLEGLGFHSYSRRLGDRHVTRASSLSLVASHSSGWLSG